MGNRLKHVRNGVLLLAAAIAGLSAGRASAGTLPYTITDSTPSYPGYDVTNIQDTGSNKFLTDYASLGGGTSTFITMDFGKDVQIDSFLYADRSSSGGGNGSNAGGPLDDVTSFTLTFSNVPTFDTSVYQNTYQNTGPTKSYPPGDITTGSLNVLARYVKFQVDTIASPTANNVGGSDLEFSAVPVPMAAVGGFGLFAILGLGKLRKSTVLA